MLMVFRILNCAMVLRILTIISTILISALISFFSTIAATPLFDQQDLYHYHANATSQHNEPQILFFDKPNMDILAHVEFNGQLKRITPDAYESVRNMFFRYEESKQLGADIPLSKKELQANEIIMAVKIAEYNEGLITPHLFKPSQHIFSVLDTISASQVFRILSKMPKGAVLHSHDTALCSTDFLIELTYRQHLWMCNVPGKLEGIALKFNKNQPTDKFETSCIWSLLSELRHTKGSNNVDKYLRDRFTMYPTEKFLDVNVAWKAFRNIFGLLDGLLRYKESWADYYYNALNEFYADGVQYLELRTTLPTLYDLDGTIYKPIETVKAYIETLEKFKRDHPDFIGSRIIYAPTRNVDEKTFAEYMKICIEIESKYPDFVAGFDLVGQEELGRPLKDFIPQLLSMPEHIKFFFHAAETNWYGSSVDENLIDAVLLGTKRIGHGFGIIKHPLILEMVKAHKIAIEINPISNQVLQLVTDYRNHPCSHLFANDYPVVISSDDPSFWKAKPLTHDFYIAFLGIASAHADLRLLKKLAINSIQYSSLDEVQKAAALVKWSNSWDHFIDWVINDSQENAATKNTHMYNSA